MHLSYADLKLRFDPTTFSRGEQYARDGRVVNVQIKGDILHGEVKGSGRNVYRQAIRFAENSRGVQVKGECDCPMSYNCKHVVAVLLTRLKQAPIEAAGGFLSMGAEIWLRQLNELQADVRTAQGSGKGLLYALIPGKNRRVQHLHLCRPRARKGGAGTAVTMVTDLNSLLVRQPGALAPEDDEAIRLMAALKAGSGYYDEIVPTGPLGARLLGQLCARGCLVWADTLADLRRGQMVVLKAGASRAGRLDWRAHGNQDDAVALGWVFDDGEAVEQIVATEPMYYRQGDQFGELLRPEALAAISPLLLQTHVAQAPPLRTHERATVAARLAGAGLDRIVPLPQEPEVRRRTDIIPTPILLLDSHFVEWRNGVQQVDVAVLSFAYDDILADHDSGPVLYATAGDAVELIERNMEAERVAAKRLAELGFAAPASDSPLAYETNLLLLSGEQEWLEFVRRDGPRLHDEGWRIFSGDNYRYDVVEAEDWYADLNEVEEGGNAWFALELGILVEGQRHALLPLLLNMIRSAPRDFDQQALAARDDASEVLVELDDGTPVVLPWLRVKPILATLGELYFTERIGRALHLPFTDAARLAELEAAAQLRWLGGERVRELGRKLNSFEGIRQVAPPAGLTAQLRQYQLAGLAWMQFLREYDFAGILADDMGLGKTIQTLAHILAEKEAGRLDGPALVVAPTTLMGNWQAEAARFTPGLRVLLLHGKDRKDSFDAIGGADIVLTTYALLARDEAALRKHRYHLLILDEAQYIKNSKSKAAQTVRLLDARHRLCLTGTPVQNHLGELWSQFHFLMPGLLGDEKTFNAEFRKPIEQGGDKLRRELLGRRIKPFMLRRTKDKVATELPPKTEIVLPVELGSGQRDLYETVRIAMDRKVRDEIDRKGIARSQIVILDALLKLRQVCCDPRLVRRAEEAGSAKLDTLMELLDTLLSEGRKVLVFSQFTSMLALIEDELRRRDIAFALLTGDTADRAAPVAAFQEGQVPVFLISLKAGGVGLNLTAADTVIHYDPWWNPASENQATDRAWRIGQSQPVFVYKLIARGTLEEKIQEMQRRKGELADALLSPEAELGSGIGPDDLKAIFSAAPE